MASRLQASTGNQCASGRRKLEIHYTAIRLGTPTPALQYRMEGLERDWTLAGQRRVAYYTTFRWHLSVPRSQRTR